MPKRNKPAAIQGLTKPKQLAFGWYGGKFSHLNWLLPLLEIPCHHYCEPFAGSGAVILNRPPSNLETFNDLDGEVVHFFKVLREQPDEFHRQVALTPCSREEFVTACLLDPNLTDLERARRFFVRARQVRTGLATQATPGRWANYIDTSRSGMSGLCSRWLNSVAGLPEIAERLQRVQIENRPAIECIHLYDTKETLFYVDPPYVHLTRGDSSAYQHEMSDADHIELANVLNRCKGKIAISGYESELYEKLFLQPKWTKIAGPTKTNHSSKGERTEYLWTNYDVRQEPGLFA